MQSLRRIGAPLPAIVSSPAKCVPLGSPSGGRHREGGGRGRIPCDDRQREQRSVGQVHTDSSRRSAQRRREAPGAHDREARPGARHAEPDRWSSGAADPHGAQGPGIDDAREVSDLQAVLDAAGRTFLQDWQLPLEARRSNDGLNSNGSFTSPVRRRQINASMSDNLPLLDRVDGEPGRPCATGRGRNNDLQGQVLEQRRHHAPRD